MVYAKHDFMPSTPTKPKVLRCCSLVIDKNTGGSRRCKRAAMGAGLHCSSHAKARENLDRPRITIWVITFNFKPARWSRITGYRKTVYGRPFDTEEKATQFLNLNWGMLTRNRRLGERVCSASVETLKI